MSSTQPREAADVIELADNLARTIVEALHSAGRADTLAPDVSRVLGALLVEGRPVTPERAATALDRPVTEAEELLRRLPSAEFDEEGNLVALSLDLRPTEHRLEIDGRVLYAWCAVDALAAALSLDKPVHIASYCYATRRPVSIDVAPTHVERVDPAGAVCVAAGPIAPTDVDVHRARHNCSRGHFFSSAEAAAPFLAQVPPGLIVLPVEDAFTYARRLVGQLDRFLGTSG